MSKKHMGSSIDDFLKKEGIFDEAQAQAGSPLKTSRTQVDRLLDPKTTSLFQVCSGRRRWLDDVYRSSWFRAPTPLRSRFRFGFLPFHRRADF